MQRLLLVLFLVTTACDGSSSPDSGEISDAGAVDVAPPDVMVPVVLGPVQCREAGDCGSGDCNLDTPGGVCGQCVGTECPADTGCNEEIGVCVRTCGDDSDCNLGWYCSTFIGRCLLQSCETCPAPYVCRDDMCRRPLCGVDGSCPDPLVCLGDVCVEPE
jgi:hypothetical protein